MAALKGKNALHFQAASLANQRSQLEIHIHSILPDFAVGTVDDKVVRDSSELMRGGSR
jgi:hypothetical protein